MTYTRVGWTSGLCGAKCASMEAMQVMSSLGSRTTQSAPRQTASAGVSCNEHNFLLQNRAPVTTCIGNDAQWKWRAFPCFARTPTCGEPSGMFAGEFALHQRKDPGCVPAASHNPSG